MFTSSANISIVQGEHAAETFESNNVVIESGVNYSNESVSKSNTNVFVSGGILFQSKNDSNSVVSDQTAKSDLHVSASNTSVTKFYDGSCKCNCVRNGKAKNNTDNSSAKVSDNKQICFNCGTAGHIARNCMNRMFVSHTTKRGENEFRGRSLTRKIPKTHSRNGDLNTTLNKKFKRFQKNKQVFCKNNRSLPKSTQAKPKSNLSKSRKGSSNSSSRKSTGSKQTNKFLKPNLQWIPKSFSDQSPLPSNSKAKKESNEKLVKRKSQPRIVMTWVPKTK